MIYVSFFKPTDYFSGLFNKFVTWFTAGDYCHCELVLETTPQQVMSIVKEIYADASASKYPEKDCARMIQQIESHFFDDARFRTAVRTRDTLWFSFSLLWGYPMTVRLLDTDAFDSWFRVPDSSSSNVQMLQVNDIDEDALHQTLRFGIEELGKQYDVSGALCAWLPWHSGKTSEQQEQYFCSEFCVLALQRLGKCENIDAKHTTPNRLFKLLASGTI